MPWAPKQRCKAPGCRERQVGRYCARHELASPRNHFGVRRQARGLGIDYDRAQRAMAGLPCELRLPGCTGVASGPDHRIPRSRGGTNDPANLRPACAHCQRVQGGRLATSARAG